MAYLTTPKPEEQMQPIVQQQVPIQLSNTFGLQITTVKSEEVKREEVQSGVKEKVSEKRDYEMIDTTKQMQKEIPQPKIEEEDNENDGMMMDLDLPDIVGDDDEDEQ